MRRITKQINVGKVKIGSDHPITVQSMTNTLTTDIESTVKQIKRLEEAGADLVRVSCPDEDSTKALKQICKHSKVPIIADIHFHYKRALEAADNGAKCLRINPGNIGTKDKLKEIIKSAKYNGCSIRIGVNAGSLEQDILESVRAHDITRFLGHIPKLKLVRGNVMETLPRFLDENPHLIVSLLHLDVDLYEPTKLALECLVPRMPKGAVIMFDELNMRQFPGETLAAIESLGINNMRIVRFPYATCMSYVVIE